MAACCYFGVDLPNQIDYNFPSRLTDGTPYSSSDLLSSSLFSLGHIITSPIPFFLLSLLRQNCSKSNLSSLLSLDKIIVKTFFCFSRTKKSKSNFNSWKRFQGNFISVLVAISIQFCKKILGSIFFLTYKNSLLFSFLPYYCHWSLNSVH